MEDSFERIEKLTKAVFRLRTGRNYWLAMSEEMEKRWREAKQKNEELRKENWELKQLIKNTTH